ncbi:MAG: hypothetical protein AAGF58_11585, partial [Pseudomonadota bacterium]
MLLDLLASGRLIDFILGLVFLEAIAVVLLNRMGLINLPVKELAGTLFAGVFLMLALKLALTGSNGISIAVCLTLALFAHCGD